MAGENDKAMVGTKQPELVKQEHGGALLSGGMPGNAGGGRPSTRAKMMAGKVMETVMTRLDEMASGRVEVELVGTCPGCGHEGEGETMTVRAYQDFLLLLIDKVAPHQDVYQQPVDDTLVERLGRVVIHAVADLPKDKQDEILSYIEERWTDIVAEYNETVAKSLGDNG